MTMPSYSLLLAVLLSSIHPLICHHDFIQRIHMDDGQDVVRVRFQNETAMQTSFAGFRLLEVSHDLVCCPCLKPVYDPQVADQTTFIRVWFHGSEIIDCGFETEAEAITNFLQDFYSDGRNICTTNDSCPV